MIVVGVDPSLTSTGVACVAADGQLVSTFTIKPKKTDFDQDRWAEICDWIRPLAIGCADIWVEDVFTGPSAKTTIQLAKLSGAILHDLHKVERTPGLVLQQTWKKHHRCPGKPDVYWARARLMWPDWDFASIDEAAAALIAAYGLHVVTTRGEPT